MKVWFSAVKTSWIISSALRSSVPICSAAVAKLSVTGLHSLQQKDGCFRDAAHLIEEQRKELLFAWEEPHNTSNVWSIG